LSPDPGTNPPLDPRLESGDELIVINHRGGVPGFFKRNAGKITRYRGAVVD
jgi:hypothetical protein